MNNNNKLLNLLIAIIICGIIFSCDNNHRSAFDRIQRNDIASYNEFIRKYPQSIYVSEARERISIAKEELRLQKEQQEKEEEMQRLQARYGENSLTNGAQPYHQWYGWNSRFDNFTPHSEIQISAPNNSDVIAIVRYNNMNGLVAGHCYVKAGMASTIPLANGHNYQTFFYFGEGWYPDKQMNKVRGGFIKSESYSKDESPAYLDNNILTYKLSLQADGNFMTSKSSEEEMF